MVNKFKLSKTVFYSSAITNIILICWAVWVNCDYLYAILLFTWINMMFYSINKLTQRILLFCFGIAFFTFLIGRDGMEYFFNHESETLFTKEVNHHAYLSMLLGLIGVWISFALYNHGNSCPGGLHLDHRKAIFYHYIRRYSLLCFYIVYPLAMSVNIVIAYFVIKYGYAAKFTDLRALIEASPVFYVFTKIELLLPTAFCIYMATLPCKKKFLKITKPYFVYLLFTLGTGGRGDFILGILLIIVFMAFMQQTQPNIIWIDKRKLKYGILFVPIIAIGSSFINVIRFGGDADDISITEGFSNFFYDQGVTSNAVKRAYQYEDYIPKQKDYYSFEFLHTGIVARLLGNKVYQGNTIDHATKGGSFTHALGYTVMSNGYLAGRGTGTSYIAELFYDFGYIGILLGSCIYGYIFSLANNFRKSGIFIRALVFIILTKILWAPRGGYSGFLSFIFAPTTLFLLMFVFACAQISYIKYIRRHGYVLDYI